MDEQTLNYMGRRVDIGRKLSGQIYDVKNALEFLKSEKSEDGSQFRKACEISLDVNNKHCYIKTLLGIERNTMKLLGLLKPTLIQHLEDRLVCLEKEYAGL